MLCDFTDSQGRPVTRGWIVAQAFPNATCIDQAHAGLGVWVVPDGTEPGSRRVTVETAWGKTPARSDTITWTPRG